MAQKPKAVSEKQDAELVRKREMENLERRLHEHLEKRNEYNKLAQEKRAERDQLNEARRGFLGRLDALKRERDALNGKVREHKRRRNDFQRAAKDLLQQKRAKKGALKPSVPLQAEQLKHEVQMLEFKQETTVMTVQKENALIKEIAAKRKEHERLKKELARHTAIKVDLSDTDAAIGELFAKADEEHRLVEQFFAAANAKHAAFMALVQEASILIGEANRRHKEFVEAREKAQAEHDKGMELRDKVMEMRGARRKEREESRAVLKERRAEVRKALADPGKLQEHADTTLERLKKGGKITLR